MAVVQVELQVMVEQMEQEAQAVVEVQDRSQMLMVVQVLQDLLLQDIKAQLN